MKRRKKRKSKMRRGKIERKKGGEEVLFTGKNKVSEGRGRRRKEEN